MEFLGGLLSFHLIGGSLIIKNLLAVMVAHIFVYDGCLYNFPSTWDPNLVLPTTLIVRRSNMNQELLFRQLDCF